MATKVKQLTAEDIDAMAAGPEMDALVAERVMGWRRQGVYWRTPDDRLLRATDHYSNRWAPGTDIAAAWQVVEHTHLFDDGAITEHLKSEFIDGRWYTEQGWAIMEYVPRFGETVGEVVAWAPTAPLAICRAALKATLPR